MRGDGSFGIDVKEKGMKDNVFICHRVDRLLLELEIEQRKSTGAIEILTRAVVR